MHRQKKEVVKTADDLAEKYPVFFRDVYCGNFCPDRWVPMLDRACAIIENHFKSMKEPLTSLKVAQTKDKRGGLRFYYDLDCTNSNVKGFVDGVVTMCESLSWYIK